MIVFLSRCNAMIVGTLKLLQNPSYTHVTPNNWSRFGWTTIYVPLAYVPLGIRAQSLIFMQVLPQLRPFAAASRPFIKDVGIESGEGSKMDQNLPTDSYKNMPKRGEGCQKIKKNVDVFYGRPLSLCPRLLAEIVDKWHYQNIATGWRQSFFCWPTYFSKEDLALLMRNA